MVWVMLWSTISPVMPNRIVMATVVESRIFDSSESRENRKRIIGLLTRIRSAADRVCRVYRNAGRE